MNELLKQAEKFCQYGENYNRHIHTAAAQLRSAIERGFGESMLQTLTETLKIRLERWAK